MLHQREVARIFGPLLLLFLSNHELELSRFGKPLDNSTLRELYRTKSPDIMFLMETKNDDEFIKKKTKDFHYTNYFSIPPIGLSGGLALLWKDTVDVKVLESLPNLIDTEVTFKGSPSFVSFVYGALL